MIEIDRIVVKGKAEAVSIFALLGTAELAGSERFRALEQPHATMLACYRRQDWDGASAALGQCRGLLDGLEGLYALYAARIDGFRQSPPPPDWDGVYIALSK
jgi:adenylate cyclase